MPTRSQDPKWKKNPAANSIYLKGVYWSIFVTTTVAKMLFSQEIKGIKDVKTKGAIIEAEQKLKSINAKIDVISLEADKPKEESIPGNWTESYAKFDTFEDIEELKHKKKIEEDRITSLEHNTENLGHYHDHTKEREIFEKSEEEKMKLCEKNRLAGENFCFCPLLRLFLKYLLLYLLQFSIISSYLLHDLN